MNSLMLNILINGIKIKLRRGGDLEEILNSYTKLTNDEKEYIRNVINNNGGV